MISKPIAVGLVAAACVAASAGGAYVAVRQNEPDPASPVATSEPSRAGKSEAPVAETEAVITPPPAVEAVDKTSARTATRAAAVNRPSTPATRPATRKDSASAPARPSATTTDSSRSSIPSASDPAPLPERPSGSRETPLPPPATPLPSGAATPPVPEPVPDVPSPAKPQFVEVVVPASSVVGLHVSTAITSETAKVEDRVEARVTRDVIADGRVAIPAGTKVIGDVTLVERGGKMKDKARLGVRFHTLVLADGDQVPLRTDAIFREGASPGAESARKIGGAAMGGAIIGAIIGGAKGAAIGSATGAAGGSAVVMAGDRNAATLPAGTIVTVRLSSPVAIDVEREQ
jgi:hypothetical protein